MKYSISIKKVHFKCLLLVFISFCLSSKKSYSQTYSTFHDAKTIEAKIQIGDQISDYYSKTDLDTLQMIGTELLLLANKKQHIRGINYARLFIGMCYTRSEKITDGLRLLRLSKNYFMELEDFSMVSAVTAEIGIGYQNSGKLKDAYNWYHESLKYADISEDPIVKYITLLNIAKIHIEQREYDKAKSAAIIYKDWAITNNMFEKITNAYAVLGTIYLSEENYPDAIEYFELSELFAKKTKSDALKAHAINNIAIAKFIQGDQDESLELFKTALEMRIKVKNPHYICDAYLNLGGIYFEMGQTNNAIQTYTIGRDIAHAKKLFQNEIDLIKALIEANNERKTSTIELKKELREAEEQLEISKKKRTKNDLQLNKELNYYSPLPNTEVEEKNLLSIYILAGIVLIVFLIIFKVKFVNSDSNN